MNFSLIVIPHGSDDLTGGTEVGLHPMAATLGMPYDGAHENYNRMEGGTNMPLINVIMVLIATGVGLWAINTFIPMAKSIKRILNWVVIAVICLWLLQVFGILDSVRSVRVR